MANNKKKPKKKVVLSPKGVLGGVVKMRKQQADILKQLDDFAKGK